MGVCCYSGATNKTSTISKHEQQFQLDEHHSATDFTINIVTFIQQRFGAGRSMNTATAASPVRYMQLVQISVINNSIRLW